MVTRKILIALQQFFASTGLRQGRPSCRQPGFFWIKDVSSSGDRHRSFRAWWTANKLELPSWSGATNFGTAWYSAVMSEQNMLDWLAREGANAASRAPKPVPAAPVLSTSKTAYPGQHEVPKGQPRFIIAVTNALVPNGVQQLLRCDGEASLLANLRSLETQKRPTVFKELPDGSMQLVLVEVETRLKFT